MHFVGLFFVSILLYPCENTESVINFDVARCNSRAAVPVLVRSFRRNASTKFQHLCCCFHLLSSAAYTRHSALITLHFEPHSAPFCFKTVFARKRSAHRLGTFRTLLLLRSFEIYTVSLTLQILHLQLLYAILHIVSCMRTSHSPNLFFGNIAL